MHSSRSSIAYQNFGLEVFIYIAPQMSPNWTEAPVPQPSKILLVIALEEEATPVKAALSQQYSWEHIEVCVTGVMEHNALSQTAYALTQGRFHTIFNFGSAGLVGARAGELRLGDSVLVNQTERFDCYLPYSDYDAEFAPLEVVVPPTKLPSASCASGNRFTDGQGHSSALEDCECYGLAHLAKRFSKRFASLKFISNIAGDCGNADVLNHSTPSAENVRDLLGIAQGMCA